MDQVDGHVTDDFNAFLVAVAFEGMPLLEKEVLKEDLLFNRVMKRFSHGSKVLWSSLSYGLWPIDPNVSLKMGFQGHKERVIIKPIGILCAEVFILMGLFPGFEMFKGLMKKPFLKRFGLIIVNTRFRKFDKA